MAKPELVNPIVVHGEKPGGIALGGNLFLPAVKATAPWCLANTEPLDALGLPWLVFG